MRNTWKAAIALLVLAFLSEPVIASEVQSLRQPEATRSGDRLVETNKIASTINVGLLIEIPASKLLFRHHLSIPKDSTVSQAVEYAYTVKHGLVCCDSRDIWSVNGLAVDPYQEKWWVIKVNGNTQNTSSTRKLEDGDILELIYQEKAFYPANHVRLEDWVKNVN